MLVGFFSSLSFSSSKVYSESTARRGPANRSARGMFSQSAAISRNLTSVFGSVSGDVKLAAFFRTCTLSLTSRGPRFILRSGMFETVPVVSMSQLEVIRNLILQSERILISPNKFKNEYLSRPSIASSTLSTISTISFSSCLHQFSKTCFG